MQIRVSFEWGAGVCLWADDAEARARWCSAIEWDQLPLTPELVAEGEALIRIFDEGRTADDASGEQRWTEDEATAFHGRAARWTERVTEALALAGIVVAPYGALTEDASGAAGGEEFDGCVMAIFRDEMARAAAERAESASAGWAEVAVWHGDALKFRASERTPAELLAKLEQASGFVLGWWQTRESGSADAMIEGDPEDHARECVRGRNATGLANFLSWLGVQRVHLGEELAGLGWQPTSQHRLASAGGSWWEWISFARNATKALQGGRPSERYLRSEKERLFWKWTHGGSRAGWPASFAEALERIGLRREAFARWTK